jgi:tetratricopeptide (TPR) repeat protein
MLRWATILSLILIAALPGRADEARQEVVAAGVAEFTAAYQAWDGARFTAAAGLFRQATTNAPASITNFYWLGAAEFHRMLQLQNAPVASTNRAAVFAAMEAAIAALSQAVKLDGQHAESHAMLGTLYGMKINGNLLRAARFGPRVQKHRAAAMQSGTDNPRVRYLLGTCQFHTAKKPPELREALASFLAAESLFAAEARRPAGPLEPRWGYATCLTFIGRTHALLGERDQAAEYFRRALARQPSDHLAKDGLARVTEAR